MNVSLNSNYFVAQMKTKEDQDFFYEYHNHFQIHLEHEHYKSRFMGY